jgi:hypothetical protein
MRYLQLAYTSAMQVATLNTHTSDANRIALTKIYTQTIRRTTWISSNYQVAIALVIIGY